MLDNMKVLFLTTFCAPFEKEHFFTIDVYDELCKQLDSIVLGTAVFVSGSEVHIDEKRVNARPYYVLKIPEAYRNNHNRIGTAFEQLYQHINPSVIHSNMIESYEVEAAKNLNLPICLTVHIGGFICPRGGGNGFLTNEDKICDCPVSDRCWHCISQNLPLSSISCALLRYCPESLCRLLRRLIPQNKVVYYLSAFLAYRRLLENSLRKIQAFKYATIIAANHRLVELLRLNGMRDNVVLIPHGVKHRNRLCFPEIKQGQPVKFFFLGRVQYSKGLHILLEALNGIDPTLYELHIIGDAEMSGTCQRYWKKIIRQAKALNVHFHGRVPNDMIAEAIADYHVMVHPAICLEVYGIAIAEALSMGRPVLATRCGGIEMQVKDGYNGWLCEPNSVPALRNSILYLLNNKEMVKCCADNATLPHSLSEYVGQLARLYREKEMHHE